jgi:hypothetical protein
VFSGAFDFLFFFSFFFLKQEEVYSNVKLQSNKQLSTKQKQLSTKQEQPATPNRAKETSPPPSFFFSFFSNNQKLKPIS